MFSTEADSSAASPRPHQTRHERQQQFRDATRRAILDAALELFVQDGYASVSMRNIAGKVEYSPAAIYSYFPSKDDIFFALAEEGFTQLGQQEVTAPADTDPLDAVRAMLLRLYRFSVEQPQYFALVFLDRTVPRIGREYQRFGVVTNLKQQLESRLARCVEAGIFPAGLDVYSAGRLLFLSILGVASARLSNRMVPGEDADLLARHAVNVTLAGLRSEAAPLGTGRNEPDACGVHQQDRQDRPASS